MLLKLAIISLIMAAMGFFSDELMELFRKHSKNSWLKLILSLLCLSIFLDYYRIPLVLQIINIKILIYEWEPKIKVLLLYPELLFAAYLTLVIFMFSFVPLAAYFYTNTGKKKSESIPLLYSLAVYLWITTDILLILV